MMSTITVIIFPWLVLLLVTSHVHAVSEGSSGSRINDHRQVQCIEAERRALLNFKQGLVDSYDRLCSWTNSSNSDCCSWGGIRCDNLTNHVIMLDLGDTDFHHRIGGNIGPSLVELQFLEYLDLYGNDFTRIPKFIGSFKNLTHVDLAGNPINGSIPSQFGNLTKLQSLSLGSDSQIIADDLEWLYHLPSLRNFYLDNTKFTKAGLQSFNMPPSLSTLRISECHFPDVDTSSLSQTNSSDSLETLYMSGNSIYSNTISWLLNSNSHLVDLSLSTSEIGTINPSQLENLTKLNYLDVDAQKTVDNFEWLSHFPSLTSFRFSGASFTNNGLLTFKLPPSLSTLEIDSCQFPKVDSVLYRSFPNSSNSLTSLSIDASTVHPTAITWLMNSSTNLVELSIQSCSIDGSLPDSFQKTTSLAHIVVSSSRLGNQIPKSLGNLTKLQTLDLRDNNLNGTIQDLFESLSGCVRNSLEILDLSFNQIRGKIPDDVKPFISLRELYLSYNLLEGGFPAHSMPSLTVFEASDNRLNDTLPESIGQLHSLERLDIASNSLSGVVSEVHFEKLSNLKELDLSSNSLTLSFNSNWVPPFQLTTIQLSSCKLGPQFPSWLHNQLNVSYLDISYSGISGAIPNWFSNISSKLEDLDLSSNQLNGTLQNFPFMSSSWGKVNLSSNQFHGSVPPSLSKAVFLYLSNNKFSHFTSFLCDITDGATTVLDLSNNQLSGSLPNCWWNLRDLAFVKLDNNKLSGVIPSSMSLLHQVAYLNLGHNNFSRSFPSQLKNCTNLQVLDAGENNWKGEIPTWIGESLVKLLFLRLKSNRFQGSIPSNLCNLQFLQILDLSNNNISGTIPSCIYNFTSMVHTEPEKLNREGDLSIVVPTSKTVGLFYKITAFIIWKGVEYKYEEILGLLRIIDLSSNKLTGEIPRELENLAELLQLNLSRNHLSGTIPKNIGKLSKIESLDLSHNNLSGEIPASISQVSTLDHLDLSDNQLSGRIPTGTQLQSFNASAYAGNLELCGEPLPTCPGDQTLDSDGNDESSFEDDGEWFDMSWFQKGIGVGFAVGFFGVCGNLLFITSWRIAYFRFLSKLGDWIYVIVVVKWATLKRWLSI